MHVRLTDDAKADLREIETFLKPRSSQGLERMLSAIFTTIRHLETFPLLGREGREEGTREISVPNTPYFIVYSIANETTLDIDRVFHERLQYPVED